MYFFHKFPISNQNHRVADHLAESEQQRPEVQTSWSKGGSTGMVMERSPISLEGPPDALVTVANRSYHYFSGNAYLGLQSHPQVLAATCEAALRYGTGTGTTRFAFTAPPVLKVEQLAAKYLCTQKALYYGSEYLGPQILLETLDETVDRVFVDEASDKSIFHAIAGRPSKDRPVVFRHNDPDSLQLELRKHLKESERPLVMTNGVFPNSGTIAPLDRYAMVLSSFEGSALLIDDSHGLGVLGQYGRGSYEHFGLATDRINLTARDETEGDFRESFDGATMDVEPIGDEPFRAYRLEDAGNSNADWGIMNRLPVWYYHTAAFTKAIGGNGGIMAGSELFVERLTERSTAFGSMSAPPSPLAAGTSEGLVMTFSGNALRATLRKNTHDLKKKINGIGIATDSSDVPILAITLGTSGNMRRIQKGLAERGVLISYIPYRPGLPSDGILRIAVFATHTTDMLDHFVEQLRRVV